MLLQVLRIYFRHNQRHVRLHPPRGAVVDTDGAGLHGCRDQLSGDLGGGGKERKIDALK